MPEAIYYLSSLDSTRFEPVRECRILRSLVFDSGKDAVEADIVPGVVGQDFNRGRDIDRVFLVARHEGASVSPVTEFPLFVFISIPRSESDSIASPISSDDLDIIGWGELYRTRQDAEVHSFG